MTKISNISGGKNPTPALLDKIEVEVPGGTSYYDTIVDAVAPLLAAIPSDVISDTDSTDSLGSSAIKWLKGWFDSIRTDSIELGHDTANTLTAASGVLSIEGVALTGTPEGTAIKSTGEAGASKFLREDGDGTSSWQAAGGGGDGWTSVSDTWVYASATTITVPSGAASIYSVGDKLKMTNTGTKYNYVTGVADTVLTVAGNGVANAAITAPKYSKSQTPLDFPATFSWTPVWTRSITQFDNDPTVAAAIWKLDGTRVTGQIDFTMPASAGGAGEIYASLPSPVAVTADVGVGQEIASSAKTFSLVSNVASQFIVFYDVYPVAVIADTVNYHYVGHFFYWI